MGDQNPQSDTEDVGSDDETTLWMTKEDMQKIEQLADQLSTSKIGAVRTAVEQYQVDNDDHSTN